MTTLGLFSQYAYSSGWPALCLLGLAGLVLLCRLYMRHSLISLAFAFPVSVAAAIVIARLWPAPSGTVQGLARSCAAAALIWSVCAAAAQPRREGGESLKPPTAAFSRLARVVALLLSVVSVIVLTLILSMRAVVVVVDLVQLDAHPSEYGYGFGPDGLWPLGFVFLTCAVSWFSTRDRRLITCQLLCAIMLAIWVCLLGQPVRATAAGGVERTAVTLGLLGVVPLLLVLGVLAATWLDSREPHPVESGSSGMASEVVYRWPALTICVTVIATGVLLLVCYHLAVPVAVKPGGYRLAALMAAVSAGLTAFACFALLRTSWNASLSDSVMALTSLGLCALATVAVPGEPHAPAVRYPMVFNAMILGLAAATVLCVWLGTRPQARPDQRGTWPTVLRLGPVARRFAFLNAALALVMSAAMAMWPRWPAIATMDHTLGRVTAGFSANLVLLLVTLWASRRLHKLTFQVLTLLVLFSTAAFLVVRVLPFSARFG